MCGNPIGLYTWVEKKWNLTLFNITFFESIIFWIEKHRIRAANILLRLGKHKHVVCIFSLDLDIWWLMMHMHPSIYRYYHSSRTSQLKFATTNTTIALYCIVRTTCDVTWRRVAFYTSRHIAFASQSVYLPFSWDSLHCQLEENRCICILKPK